jgi:hypothetical protein
MVRNDQRGQAQFEVRDSSLAELTDDLFGLWEVSAPEAARAEPSGVAEEVAFGTMGTAAARPEQTWSIGLPPDPSDAARHLGQRESRLRTVEHNLADLGLHLDEFTEVLTTIPRVPGEEAAFGLELAGLPPLTPEEYGLKEDLDSLRRKMKPAGWQEASRQFRHLLDEVGKSVAHFAWVETKEEEQFLGHSVVDWTGDLNTLWWSAASRAQRGLHERSLTLALASRGALLYTFVLTTRTVAKLPALMTMPGGFVLALPVVWRFINQVLKEYQAYQETKRKLQGGT